MITKSPPRHHLNCTQATQPQWMHDLRHACRDPLQLCQQLGLDPAHWPGGLEAMQAAMQDFPLRVPQAFIARMRQGDPQDPLLLQVLPQGLEHQSPDHYLLDPLQETGQSTPPGLLHKYASRVLVTLTGACAIHCRYCFRRHFPYAEAKSGDEALDQLVNYCVQHPDINEVVLSGGDPLMWPDERLAHWTAALAALPQIKRLRCHTRLPVVLPSRVDDKLLSWLEASPVRQVWVIHCNHPQEIDASVRQALADLQAAGVQLLNQTVLLKGINDCPQTLASLSEGLFEAGVMPYYLHMLDPVKGAAHFDIDEAEAKNLYAQLLALLPGYLVPKLVREVPGQPAKTPLGGC